MKISNSEQTFPVQLQWTNKLILRLKAGSEQHGTDKNNVPRSRFLHACCLLGQNLYLFGGKDRYAPLKDFWKLNLFSGEWIQIETTETMLPHLQGHTMVSYKSQIFIFGGSFYETVEETPLWIFNPDLNILRKYPCDENLPRPLGRREHSAVTHNNFMYVFGGFLDSSGSSDEFWTFDMEAEQWRQISKSRPGPRHGHVAVASPGCMWVHGGMKNLTYLSDLWSYNFAMCTWKKVKGSGTFPALTGHTANIVRTDIVMVGGSRNGKPSSDIWIFSFSHDSWRCIETPKESIFLPISLHKSVLIDPTKLSQVDTEGAAKSVPNLKTPMPLLPWEHNSTDVRPWTSPAPGSQEESILSKSGPDLQLLTLLDKNNNSEEDITGLSIQDCLCESSTGTHCLLHQGHMGRDYSTTEDSQGNNSVFNSKSDILKIRPASYEGCCDDSPLLERFQSIESDVDLGESNAVMTLSDENVFVEPSKEDSFLRKSSSNHDTSVSKYQPNMMKNSCSCEGILEPSHQNTTLLSYHSSSIKHENKPASLNSYNTRLSMFSDSQEHFFSNPLYESLYETDQGNENVKENKTNDSHHGCERSKSSDLIIEDLEYCEEDLTLRNTDIAFPSRASIRWSSLKDLSSSCEPYGISSDEKTNLDLSQKARSHSFSDVQNEINYESSRFHGKLRELKNYAYATTASKRYSRLHSLNDIKKQSRQSLGISKTYVKHSAASHHRHSCSHFTQETNDLLSSRENVGDSHSSPNAICSNSRKIPSSADTWNSYNHFVVQSNKSSANIGSGFKHRNNSSSKFGYSAKSEGQVLVILGGQTEVSSFDKESLKIWNCYLL